MKKMSYMAAAVLMGATLAATPIQTMAAGPLQVKGTGANRAGVVSILSGGNIACANNNSLKDFLENCQLGNVQIITIPCLPGNQQWPGTGNNNQNNQPEVEDNNQNCQPGTGDNNQNGQPGTGDNNQNNQPGAGDNNQNSQPGAGDNNQNGQPDVEDNNQNNQPGTDNNNQNNQPGTEDNNQSNNPGTEDSEQSVHAYVKRIVELVNEERAKAGLNPLTLKADVTEAAQVRAVECETSFSHTRPNGTSFVTALKEAGVSYRGAGENIAWGQKTPEQVMEAWMNSSGHRANIMNAKYTSIGVGYYPNAAGRNYWSQLFTY